MTPDQDQEPVPSALDRLSTLAGSEISPRRSVEIALAAFDKGTRPVDTHLREMVRGLRERFGRDAVTEQRYEAPNADSRIASLEQLFPGGPVVMHRRHRRVRLDLYDRNPFAPYALVDVAYEVRKDLTAGVVYTVRTTAPHASGAGRSRQWVWPQNEERLVDLGTPDEDQLRPHVDETLTALSRAWEEALVDLESKIEAFRADAG